MSFTQVVKGETSFNGFLKALKTLGVEHDFEGTVGLTDTIRECEDLVCVGGIHNPLLRKATFVTTPSGEAGPRRMVVEEYVAISEGSDDMAICVIDIEVYEEGNRPDLESMVKCNSGDEEDIPFTYKDKEYVVGDEAQDVNRIVLPDGTILDVGYWSEDYPPQPRDLEESFCCPHQTSDAETIAKDVYGALAKLV